MPIPEVSNNASSDRRDFGAAVNRSLTWSMFLSILIAIVLLWAIIAIVEPWDLVAVTRVLDLLIEGGIVQYHDRNPGFIAGLPDVKYYYMSQDPIDWRLVFISGGLMMLYPVFKAIQFDRIAVSYGSMASFSAHVRAFLYGDGMDRLLPFSVGRVGMANVLMSHGMDRESAAGAALVSLVFTFFEVVVFALIGLFMLGWMEWVSQIFWATAILAVAYYIVVRPGEMSVLPPMGTIISAIQCTFLGLARTRPALLVQLMVLSLLAFFFFDLSVYILMTAFDTEVVLINIEVELLLMAIVGGYIAARFVPITPGGIGQWEAGFATGLYLSGADISLALVSIAILTNVLRIVTGLILMAFAMWGEGVPSRFNTVVARFARVDD